MLELYFIFYRVPKMMTRLARERNRSALAWSLLGIAAWIGAELVVVFTFTFVYQMGVLTAGWTDPEPAGLRFLTYLLALAAALAAVTMASRFLGSRSATPQSLPAPPPPPTFS
jgi:protein-S-isoprenylcysteine O-methyltransferase Ste14